MRMTENTILITGGATGIGFAIAEALSKNDNKVIICGRRQAKLFQAKKRIPNLSTRTCDIACIQDRQALFEWTSTNFSQLNILINNAGIQREIDFTKGEVDLVSGEDEIQTNLKAPIHLSSLVIPMLMKRSEAAIVNISSGLGFIPIAIMPVYCATKAAIHSWSWSLRHQLKDTSVKVFEIIPPTVDTELDRVARDRRKQVDRGIKPEAVAEAAIKAMANDEYEVTIGQAQFLRTGSRNEPDRIFQMINSH